MSNSVLDPFLASLDVSIPKSIVVDSCISDHLPVLFYLNCEVPKFPSSLITLCSFDNFSKVSFEEDLSAVPWSVFDVFGSPDDKVDIFNTLFTEILDWHAPMKTVQVRRILPYGMTSQSVMR